jgi:sporulation protein YlmC with PRC-barrel domain
MANRELHIEQLLGRKVFDSEGKRAGRLEEVIAERHGDEWVVQEYWVGRNALLTRFSARGVVRALLGFFGAKENAGYKVPWDKLDLSHPERLRLHCPCHELEELTGEDDAGRKHRSKRERKK